MANKSNLLHSAFQGGTIPRKTFNLIEYIYNVHLSLAEGLNYISGSANKE